MALAGAPLPPLACPPGTARRGAEPFDGYEVWCEGKDPAGLPRRDGPARRFYDDGSLWVEEAFAAGKREGAFVEYHRNGNVARAGRYVAGEQDGRWIIRYESGVVEEEAEYRAGVPHGRFAAFRPDGTKRTEGRRCGGAPCGVWRSYDVRGRVEGEVEYGVPAAGP